MEIVQIIITVLLLFLLAIPFGNLIYKIISGKKWIADPVFDRVDGVVYKISGIKSDEDMSWKKYMVSLLLMNGIMCVLLLLVLMFQSYLPLNPNHSGNMSLHLAFNTAASFITNTNLQDYSGEGISYFAQLFLTAFMFIAPATGLATSAAFLRGITATSNVTGEKNGLGNFYTDIVRFTTRLLLPLSIFTSIVISALGVPQTFASNQVITTIEGTKQIVALGPVASLEAIKNLGSNGGGFFAANSAHPFENPNAISNLITIISLGLISTAFVYAFGKLTKNKNQARVLFTVLAAMLIISIGVTYMAELGGNHAFASAGLVSQSGNMEGKEARFGVGESSLFAAATTAYQVGAVNSSHDSLTPIGGMMAMWNMILQTVFGGKGTGFMYVLMYAIFTVFICGLMVGRTPEYLGKKIEGKEIKMVAIGILAHPLFALVPLGVAAIVSSGYGSMSNPSYHGLSQMIYQYLSSSANNGSGFEGIADNTPFWNISTGVVMLLGRYVPVAALLCAAGSLAQKKTIPETTATLRTDKPMFGFTLLFIIIVIGALSFFPALVLGPIAEQLSL
jgi:K+-transporting ATPase ATPase A chain